MESLRDGLFFMLRTLVCVFIIEEAVVDVRSVHCGRSAPCHALTGLAPRAQSQKIRNGRPPWSAYAALKWNQSWLLRYQPSTTEETQNPIRSRNAGGQAIGEPPAGQGDRASNLSSVIQLSVQ